jgi:hypothetical protein
LEKFLPKIRDEVLRRMKNETVGNVSLPSDWLKDLKKSNNSQNKSLSTQNKSTSTQNTTKVSDFPKRLAKLKESNPEALQNTAKAARNNYK